MTAKSPKNVAASVRQRLYNLSKKNDSKLEVVLQRFAATRFLYRLSMSEYADGFVLKGAALYQVWNRLPIRPTKDIDLLGLGESEPDTTLQIFRTVSQIETDPPDGLEFDPESISEEPIRAETAYGGFRYKLTASLAGARIRLQIDVGFGDAITPAPDRIEFPTYLDFPSPKLQAYTVYTVVAEKIEAMEKLGMLNGRMKDFYDIAALASEIDFDGNLLVEALSRTFERRGTTIPDGVPVGLSDKFAGSKDKQSRWDAFLHRGKLDPAPFVQIVDDISKFITPPLEAARQKSSIDQYWDAGAGRWKAGELKYEIEIPKADHYARWSFDQLRLKQPHLEYRGIWQVGHEFHVHCPEHTPQTVAVDGKTKIDDWFNNHRAITSPVRIVSTIPAGAKKIPDRTAAELAELAGDPRPLIDLYDDLYLTLPEDFPPFRITDGAGEINILTNEKLSASHRRSLSKELQRMQLPVEWQIGVTGEEMREPAPRQRKPNDSRFLDLVPAKRLSDTLSKEVHKLWSQDEELWIDNRVRLLRGEPVKGQPRNGNGASCIVNASTFRPFNLRNQLSIYDHVFLVIPHAGMGMRSEIYSSLGANMDELVELAVLGRLSVVLPFSVDLYPPKFISDLAEKAPDRVILTRNLMLRTITEVRKRVPLLYPPLGSSERYALLHASSKALAGVENGEIKNFLSTLIEVYGDIWSRSEPLLHRRGTVGTMSTGMGHVIAEIVKNATGQNTHLEFYSASQIIEWAAALNATAFPVVDAGGTYSEERHSEILAGLYTGVPGNWTPNYTANLNVAIQEILAVSSDVPIVDFANDFKSSDIGRFRKIMNELIETGDDLESLAEATEKFNREILAYEKRSERLGSFDLRGLIEALAKAADPELERFVPLGQWLYDRLNQAIDSIRDRSDIAGEAIDALRGLPTLSPARAIFVHRLKAELNK